MKTNQKNLIPSVLPALLTALIGLSQGSVARADSVAVVPPIRFTNLAPAAGKFVNVFFVQASEAVIGVKGQQLEFSEIMMPPIREQIPANGIVDIPSANVPKHFVAGVAVTYTYVFVAVTEALPNPLYLRNENGARKPIIDPRMSQDQLSHLPDAAFQTVHTAFISKFGLPAHMQNGVIVLDATTDLHQ